MVLSCDLITDLSLHLVADVHRTYDATVTMLLAPNPDLSETSVPGGKTNKKMAGMKLQANYPHNSPKKMSQVDRLNLQPTIPYYLDICSQVYKYPPAV